MQYIWFQIVQNLINNRKAILACQVNIAQSSLATVKYEAQLTN